VFNSTTIALKSSVFLPSKSMRLSLKLRPYALRPFRGLYECCVVVSGVKWV
jgi:hypothetical protein